MSATPGSPKVGYGTPRSTMGTPRTPTSAAASRSPVPKVTPLRTSAMRAATAASAQGPTSYRSASAVSAVSVASTARSTASFKNNGKSAAAPTVHKSAKQIAADAKKKTEKELGKHLQSMLHLKQRLRRAHDDAGKEYSGLHNSLAAAKEMMDDLAKMEAVDLGAAAAAVMERSRQAAAASASESSMLQTLAAEGDAASYKEQQSPATSRQNSPRGGDASSPSALPTGRLEQDTKRAAAPRLTQHASVLERNRTILTRINDDGNEVMKQLNLSDRELQHLMLLVDRAADIDMQCMSGTITDTVVVNGSPLYPNLTMQDSEEVITRAAAQCSKAGRFSTYIRRLMASGMSEVTHSAEQLATAMKTSAKVAQEQVTTLQRDLEGVIWEERRAKKTYAQLTTEGEKVLERLKYIHKTLRLREAAVGTIAFDGSIDPVISALRAEEDGVQLQLDQVEGKLRDMEAKIEDISARRRGTRKAVDEAKVDLDNRRSHCTAHQAAGSVEFSPSRLISASRNTSPRRIAAPGASQRGVSPRAGHQSPRVGASGGSATPSSRPEFRTYGRSPTQL